MGGGGGWGPFFVAPRGKATECLVKHGVPCYDDLHGSRSPKPLSARCGSSRVHFTPPRQRKGYANRRITALAAVHHEECTSSMPNALPSLDVNRHAADDISDAEDKARRVSQWRTTRTFIANSANEHQRNAPLTCCGTSPLDRTVKRVSAESSRTQRRIRVHFSRPI